MDVQQHTQLATILRALTVCCFWSTKGMRLLVCTFFGYLKIGKQRRVHPPSQYPYPSEVTQDVAALLAAYPHALRVATGRYSMSLF
jgi:hypothetical protein